MQIKVKNSFAVCFNHIILPLLLMAKKESQLPEQNFQLFEISCVDRQTFLCFSRGFRNFGYCSPENTISALPYISNCVQTSTKTSRGENQARFTPKQVNFKFACRWQEHRSKDGIIQD